MGGKIAKKLEDKLKIKSDFWLKATDKMVENGIADGTEGYLRSTVVEHNGAFSGKAFGDMGKGTLLGIGKGMTSTLVSEKFVRPELEKIKELRPILLFKKEQIYKSILNSYNPLVVPSTMPLLPRSNNLILPNKD